MPLAPEKLASLIDQHWGPLVAWIGGQDGNAEDIVQQSFVSLAALELAPENPVGWLYKVTRNISTNDRKARDRRARRHRAVARQERVESDVSKTTEASELLDKLNQLPDSIREIIVARTWGGFGFEEIAKMVGGSKATVWRQYKSGISILRKSYGETCETK